MLCPLRGLLLCGIAFAAAAPAQAQWLGGIVDHTKKVFRANNDWPKPFVFADRASVAQPMLIMTSNGWRRQNMISEYHFDEETAKLTSAGELKIRWILNQTNPERRTIYLQRAQRAELTAARLDAVQQAAAQMLPRGELPQVVETNMDTPGTPAEDVDNTMTQFNTSAYNPRLPTRANFPTPNTAGSSGGGGGGGAGGASGTGR